MSRVPVVENAWGFLRRFTAARIALGRAGVSQPTAPHLAFQAAHAQARDAVHAALDGDALADELKALGLSVERLRSAAADRSTYLQRPDLGRRLDRPSLTSLEAVAAGQARGADVVFVIADGLSAAAVQRHAPALLALVLPGLREAGLDIGPAVVVEQGRVAVADQVGEVLEASLACLLIGERPGLSSPDSLGVYLTHAPRVGRTDAERNCVSNIRPEGLSYRAAAYKLDYLIRESLRRRLSGVGLKDEAEVLAAEGLEGAPSAGNFLVQGDGPDHPTPCPGRGRR